MKNSQVFGPKHTHTKVCDCKQGNSSISVTVTGFYGNFSISGQPLACQSNSLCLLNC